MTAATIAILASVNASGQTEMEKGKVLFTITAAPACAVCHTLRHAGSVGEIGPNLNELKPDAQRVEQAIRNGIGLMPAFSDLSESDIQTLAKYVAQASKNTN